MELSLLASELVKSLSLIPAVALILMVAFYLALGIGIRTK